MEKQYYLELINNPSLLNSEITKTNGYILEEIKSLGIKIDKEIIFKNLNVFSLKFLNENYDLSDEEKEKIDNFLSDNAKSFANKQLTDTQIEYFLNNEIALPDHIVLNFDTLKNNPNKILKQIEINEYGMYRIFGRTIPKFTVEEIKSINKEILLEIIEVIASKKGLINDPEFREYFKELVFDNFKNPGIKLFNNFSFKSEDKESLIKLLKNTNENRYSAVLYSDIKSIDGVTDLIDKYDYAKLFKIKDIEKDFTNGEVAKNPEFFQELWSQTKERRTFDFFEFVLKNNSTIEHFREIVTKDFILKALENETYIHNLHSRIDREYNKIIVDKEIYLLDKMLELYINNEKISENKNIRDVIDEDTIFSFIGAVKNEKYEPINKVYANETFEKIEKNIRKLYEQTIPNMLNKKEISRLLDNETTVFHYSFINLAEDVLLQNPSVNSFFIINKIAKKYEKGYLDYSDRNRLFGTLEPVFKKTFDALSKNEKNKELKLQNRKYIVEILKMFEGHEDLLTEEWGKNYKKELDSIPNLSDEFNMFSYTIEDLKNLDHKKLASIYPIRKDIFTDMLSNKIKLSDDLFLNILRNVDDKDYFKYIKEYINKNLDEIKSNQKLFEQVMTNSKQKELIKIDDLSVFDKNYNQCLELIEQIQHCSEKRDELTSKFPKVEWDYSFEKLGVYKTDIVKNINDFVIEKNITKTEAKVLFVELYEKGRVLGETLEKTKKQIPFQYFSEKITKLLKEEKFEDVLNIKNNRLEYDNEPFRSYVNNLDYKDLSSNLKNNSFISLLKGEIDYDKKTNIMFKDFSKEENLLLLKEFKKIYEKDNEDGSRRNYQYLYFFNKETNHFIKEFVIENYPKDMFYSYDFLANDASLYKPSKFIKDNYTQEEIWKAYSILKEKEGFFSENDVNADYKHFFNHALFNDKEKNDEEYKKFLNFIKDKDQMLYVLLANENIFINTCSWGSKENNKTRSEVVMDYFKENFDFKLVISGLEQIVDLIEEKDQHGNFNNKLANHAIVSVIHNTYYEKYDKYGKTECYLSSYNNEETIDLMKFLWEKAPLHMLGRHVIAGANNPVEFFNKNISYFYNRKNIENLMFPNTKLEPEYLALHNEDSDSKERLIGYFSSIIDYAMETKDKEMINYISHTVEQYNYAEKNLSYDARRELYSGKSDLIVSHIAQDDRITSRLKNALLKIDLEGKLEVKAPAKKTKKI